MESTFQLPTFASPPVGAPSRRTFALSSGATDAVLVTTTPDSDGDFVVYSNKGSVVLLFVVNTENRPKVHDRHVFEDSEGSFYRRCDFVTLEDPLPIAFREGKLRGRHDDITERAARRLANTDVAVIRTVPNARVEEVEALVDLCVGASGATRFELQAIVDPDEGDIGLSLLLYGTGLSGDAARAVDDTIYARAQEDLNVQRALAYTGFFFE
jgi:hypothetical protein